MPSENIKIGGEKVLGKESLEFSGVLDKLKSEFHLNQWDEVGEIVGGFLNDGESVKGGFSTIEVNGKYVSAEMENDTLVIKEADPRQTSVINYEVNISGDGFVLNGQLVQITKLPSLL